VTYHYFKKDIQEEPSSAKFDDSMNDIQAACDALLKMLVLDRDRNHDDIIATDNPDGLRSALREELLRMTSTDLTLEATTSMDSKLPYIDVDGDKYDNINDDDDDDNDSHHYQENPVASTKQYAYDVDAIYQRYVLLIIYRYFTSYPYSVIMMLFSEFNPVS